MTAEINRQKAKLLYTSLQKTNYWYTGLSIKKYLKSKVFHLKKDFANPALNSGRWSAYCHYSQVTAFKNLLNKNNVTRGSHLLVHPLLPNYLVQTLQTLGAKITFLDINKTHLNFDVDSLNDLVKKNNLQPSGQKIDLIIAYGINGLYEEISNLANICFEKALPILAVIDNSTINSSLLELFESLKLGSILWNFGDSFLDDQLNQIIDDTLPTQNWFASWHIETRTQAILEYHLSESFADILPLVEAMLFIVTGNSQQSFFSGLFQTGLSKIFLKTKFKDSLEAKNLITQNYPKLFDLAVPDIVFDLELAFPTQKSIENEIAFSKKEVALREKSRQLYEAFSAELKMQKQGSLEIPSFYLDRVYLRYFLLTSEPSKWYEIALKEGFSSTILSPISELVSSDSKLKNAQLYSKYGLFIELN